MNGDTPLSETPYPSGRVVQIRQNPLHPGGGFQARIACPQALIPSPGQYLLAWEESGYPPGGDHHDLLPQALFLGDEPISSPDQRESNGFWAAAALPSSWGVGTSLRLRGPLGRGFTIPGDARHLGLVVVEGQGDRLLPLALQGLGRDREVALFCDLPISTDLPAALEVYPREAFRQAADWLEFLAVDLSLERLGELRESIGLEPSEGLNCPIQVLVRTPMPCGGLAECGICAVQLSGRWRLVCHAGPVLAVEMPGDMPGLRFSST